jgi:hypothetical protein
LVGGPWEGRGRGDKGREEGRGVMKEEGGGRSEKEGGRRREE